MKYTVISLAVGIVLCCAAAGFAQENVTITTYFPAPYGEYNDLNVHRDVVVHDQAGSSANTSVSSDAGGNFTIRSNRNFTQVIFEDVNRPFSYLQAYRNNGGVTWCANGYVAVGFLTTTKVPQDPADLDPSGYMVCLRGWE